MNLVILLFTFLLSFLLCSQTDSQELASVVTSEGLSQYNMWTSLHNMEGNTGSFPDRQLVIVETAKLTCSIASLAIFIGIKAELNQLCQDEMITLTNLLFVIVMMGIMEAVMGMISLFYYYVLRSENHGKKLNAIIILAVASVFMSIGKSSALISHMIGDDKLDELCTADDTAHSQFAIDIVVPSVLQILAILIIFGLSHMISSR